MDTWFAYSPVKNNPEDAAKVKYFCIAFFFSVADTANNTSLFILLHSVAEWLG